MITVASFSVSEINSAPSRFVIKRDATSSILIVFLNSPFSTPCLSNRETFVCNPTKKRPIFSFTFEAFVGL